MDDALLVHLLQRPHDRINQVIRLPPPHAPILFHHRRKRGAINILHDDVHRAVCRVLGRAVGLGWNHIIYLHDIGNMPQAYDQQPFAARPLQSGGVFFHIAGIRAYRRHVILPIGQGQRKKLLDRYPVRQVQVEADIGDAKATASQRSADQIPVFQHHLFQLTFAINPISVIPATFGASSVRLVQLRHTVETPHPPYFSSHCTLQGSIPID